MPCCLIPGLHAMRVIGMFALLSPMVNGKGIVYDKLFYGEENSWFEQNL